MTRSRVFPLLTLAAGLVLAAGGTAQPPKVIAVPKQPKVIQAPGPAAELPVVPKSVAAFVSVRAADVVDHPDLKPALELLKRTPEALGDITEMIGVPPHEMDRVTLFWPTIGSHGPSDPVAVITTRQPYNEARVLKALKAEPVFEGHGRDPWGPGAAGVKKSAELHPELSIPEPFKKQAKSDPPPATSKPPERNDPPVPEDACSAADAAPPGEPLYFALPDGPFSVLFLIDDRTLVFLTRWFDRDQMHLALLGQLMQRKPTGPLAEAIAAAGNHTLAAGVYLPPLLREFERQMPPDLAPFAALAAARTAVVTGDLTKTARLTLKLTFDDAAAARRAGPVLEEGLKTLAGHAAAAAAELKNTRRAEEKAFAPLLEVAADGLKKATVKAEGATVVATGEVDVGLAAAKATADFLQALAARKKFDERTTNLKQIGLALHNYESASGKLPNNVYGPKGEMLLSWRVLILPYLEEETLYRQFKLDEPWDSAHNKPLAEKMPKVFEVLGREAPKGKTYLQAFATPDARKVKGPNPLVGPTWLTDGNPNAISLVRIPDGTANTIAVAEARDPVVWSKPEDMPFGEKLPALGDPKADRLMVLMFDGSVRALPAGIDPQALRALVTTNGGETVDIDDDRPRAPFGPGGRPGAVDREEQAAHLFRAVQDLQRAAADARRALEAERSAAEAQAQETRRVTELFNKGLVAKNEVFEANARLDECRERVRTSEARVQKLDEELAAARRHLERAGLTPPKK